METSDHPPQPDKHPDTPVRSREHWSFKYIAILGALFVIVLSDIGLRAAGIMPPEDPLVFHVKTHLAGFTPFVEQENGLLAIRPDWVKQDEMYRFTKGTRAERLFLHPGFRPAHFTRHKSAETLRIFALGGSTTFGQWVGPEHAFPHLLEKELQQVFSHRKVEVINLGCPGLESTRVAILFKRVLAYDPDLVVVYSGHNEMLMGPDITTPAGSLANTVRAHLLRLSTLAAWFNYSLASYLNPRDYEIVSEETAALEAGKILPHIQGMQGQRYQPLPDQYLRKVTENYAENIRAMTLSAKKAGTPVIFVLPVANLAYPPEQSAHAGSFKAEAHFNALLDQARTAIEKADFRTALNAVDEAVSLSPGYALAHHLRGTILLKTGQPSAAIRDFQKAVDLNVYAHRMTSPLQAALIKTVNEYGVPWVDLRPDFQKDIGFSSAGNLFVDHCHPTRQGHRFIAEKLLPVVRETLLTSPPR